MISLIIKNDTLNSKIKLEDSATSTEMIEAFCKMLLLQSYQIGSLIDSLDEVRENLIEDIKIAYEGLGDE